MVLPSVPAEPRGRRAKKQRQQLLSQARISGLGGAHQIDSPVISLLRMATPVQIPWSVRKPSKDLYRLLGVTRDAAQEQIRRGHVKRMFEHQQNQPKMADSVFAEHILTDAAARAKYDAFLDSDSASGREAPESRNASLTTPFRVGPEIDLSKWPKQSDHGSS